MASSAARIEANRRNALKSTGPKTAEGKARSRANALKHGLAGGGIVIPPDDLAKVEEIEAGLAAVFPPVNEVVASLSHRYAVLSARLDRCEAHDAAMTEHRVRTARIDRENRRWDEVAALGLRLADDPFDALRRLKQTPEGVLWLIEQWMEVRAEVAGPIDDPSALADRAGSLLGLRPVRVRATEWGAWRRAVEGDPSGLPDDPERWAVARIDREIAGLQSLRDLVDDAAEAADRAGAGARALLDFGPEGEKARRYEAAAARDLFRVLKELRRAQEEAAEPNEPKPAPAPAPPPLPAPPPPTRVPAPNPLPPLPMRSVLDDLPAVGRGPVPLPGDTLDLLAGVPTLAEILAAAAPKAARPKLG